MHHYTIATLLHHLHQLAHPAVAHAYLVGCFALANQSILGPLQPFQLVAFLLAHLDSFHPSALRLSRGTFYFGQLGTFHFGATLTTWGRSPTCHPDKLVVRNAQNRH